ncbi:MAG: glycosyltransferase [Planctomycetota bacterium]
MIVWFKIWLQDTVTAMRWELEHHSWQFWLLSSFAIMLFLEVPRYYLAPVLVAVAHALGRPRLDRTLVRALWRRQPMVSVVVAGRNEDQGIEACLRSLLDQTYQNYEVIVVDDCSTDQTSAVARCFTGTGKIRCYATTASAAAAGGRRPPTSASPRRAASS